MSVLYLLGDSTCAIKREDARPETGWGEEFQSYVKDGWIVDNRAINGRSTKSFIDEGNFDSILEVADFGDSAIIQFGHNDSKLDKERHTDPFGSYVSNLDYMADKLKAKGVSVYFATSIARRQFDERGVIKQTHGEYPFAMHYAAFKSSVPCIDMTTTTMVELQKLGDEESKKYFMNLEKGIYPNYPDGKLDNTHLTPKGAKWIAILVARELSLLSIRPEFLRSDISYDRHFEDVAKLELAD